VACGGIGFRIEEAEVKRGRPVSSVASAVGFWQEIEMNFPAETTIAEQLEFVFNARRDEMDLLFGDAGRITDVSYGNLDAGRLQERIDAYWRELFLS
jgi:sporulation-control protein